MENRLTDVGRYENKEKFSIAEWEEIYIHQGIYLSRTRVPGGWLVVIIAGQSSDDSNVKDLRGGAGLTFVPDVNHEWIVIDQEENINPDSKETLENI